MSVLLVMIVIAMIIPCILGVLALAVGLISKIIGDSSGSNDD